ncbi:MAG: N-acetylmuramoyl-L-alanine amidase [Acetatifactor sp.]|nr:N-acetylmuramoyl-L-alanine amidase [Acetatifactor sp.]
MNKKETNVEKENMRLTMWLWVTLCGVCMSVMLWFGSNKTIVIADMSQEHTGLSVDAGLAADVEKGPKVVLQRTYNTPNSFCVPLPKGIKPENVVMENRYMSRELWIYVQGVEVDFYQQNGIYGDTSCILEGHSQEWESGLLLTLEMEDILEYRSTMEGNVLTIACSDPRDLYDFLVVLDPVGGGSDAGITGYGISEKELALEVARYVQRNFEMSNVRLYLTRTEDVEVSPEERTALAEAIRADLYIRIGAGTDGNNPDAYGIQGYYNGEYFIPGFGNTELADIVTKEVTIASSNRAVGLVPADADSILRGIGMPAMELSMGYLSNPQEEALLKQEAYQGKLASGILNGIREACERLEQLGAR